MNFFKRYGIPVMAAVLLIALTVTVGGGRIRKTANRDYYQRWVIDDAQMLSEQSRENFGAVNERLDRTYGSVMGVITVRSLGGANIAEKVYELSESGGFGQNDLVLLIALEDRQWYLGYGDQIARYADQSLRHLFTDTLDEKLYTGGVDAELAELYNALPGWYAEHVPIGGTSANRRSGITGAGFLISLLYLIAGIAVLAGLFRFLLFPLFFVGKQGRWSFGGWALLPLLALLFRGRRGGDNDDTNC